MAQVWSLGLHSSSSLSYCINEHILPPNPPPESYTWTTSFSAPNDEVLVTESAVVWSQGGVVRRVFKFKVEKEAVLAAVITWFPSDEDGRPTSETSEAGATIGKDGERLGVPSSQIQVKKRTSNWNAKSKSFSQQLGSFPRGKSLGGQPPLPEKEEHDSKLMTPSGRSRALVVFLKTQAHIFFLTGTSFIVNLPFETVYALPSPRGVVIQGKMAMPQSFTSFMDDSDDDAIGDESILGSNMPKKSPCLFTLTDPLLDVGVALNAETQSTLDADEELVFFSQSSELEVPNDAHEIHGVMFDKEPFPGEVVFAVTRNRVRGVITIWHVRYVPYEFPNFEKERNTPLPSGAVSRRRSSFGPQTATGATTPTAGAGPGSIPLGRFDKKEPEPIVNFEVENPRAGNRRVSSLVSRADLGGSIDRIPYSDIASAGSSFRPSQQTLSQFDNGPVDTLLNDLNSASLGLGFDSAGLRSEIVLSKLETIPISFSSTETERPKVFTLLAPPTTTAINGVKLLLLCVLNKDDNTLTQITFQLQSHVVAGPTSASTFAKKRQGSAKKDERLITPQITDISHHAGIQDAIKVADSGIARLLLLSTEGQFTLHSPWSPAVPITLPPILARWNTNVFGNESKQRKAGGFQRVLSVTPEDFVALTHSEQGGRVTIVDGAGAKHRIMIQMQPREQAVRLALDFIRVMLGVTLGTQVGEAVITAWMEVHSFVAMKNGHNGFSENESDVKGSSEWQAFVVTLFLLAVGELPPEKPTARRRSGLRRSGSAVANVEWEQMINTEGEWGSTPDYLRSPAWSWMADEEEQRNLEYLKEKEKTPQLSSKLFANKRKNQFIKNSIALAREFAATEAGKRVKGYLPPTQGVNGGQRIGYAGVLVTLHLLREELKLDITMEPSVRRFVAPLTQLAKWLNWTTWVDWYTHEDAEVDNWEFDDVSKLTKNEVPVPPFPPLSIYDWLAATVAGRQTAPFVSLEDLASPGLGGSQGYSSQVLPSTNITKPIFAKLTPRLKLITEAYASLITPGRSHIDVVAAMVQLKFTPAILERLPEGIAVPLKEAIARCQEQPPTTWGPEELELVERRDLKMLTGRGKPRGDFSKWQTVSSKLCEEWGGADEDRYLRTKLPGMYILFAVRLRSRRVLARMIASRKRIGMRSRDLFSGRIGGYMKLFVFSRLPSPRLRDVSSTAASQRMKFSRRKGSLR